MKVTSDQLRLAANARCLEVLRLRRNGETFKEIGVLLGTTSGRANDLYKRSLRVEQRLHTMTWANGLSQRLINTLFREGAHTRDAFDALFASGALAEFPFNFGKASFAEIWARFGVLKVAKEKKRQKRAMVEGDL